MSSCDTKHTRIQWTLREKCVDRARARKWVRGASVTMCTIQHCYHTHKSSVFDGTGKWSFCPWITIYINVRGNRTMRRVGKKSLYTKTITTAAAKKFRFSSFLLYADNTDTYTIFLLFMEIGPLCRNCAITRLHMLAFSIRSAWATFYEGFPLILVEWIHTKILFCFVSEWFGPKKETNRWDGCMGLSSR